jgi:NAD-dependent SIR2 family protein deacetylase
VPTTAHRFVKVLQDQGLLHRCYTQNIDGLERRAGISEDRLIEAHGSFDGDGACGVCQAPCCEQKLREACTSGFSVDEIKKRLKCDKEGCPGYAANHSPFIVSGLV